MEFIFFNEQWNSPTEKDTTTLKVKDTVINKNPEIQHSHIFFE